MVPSADFTEASRGAGAPGFGEPSSLRLTALMTRMVAVACTVAERTGCGGEAAESAVAMIRIMSEANALAR